MISKEILHNAWLFMSTRKKTAQCLAFVANVYKTNLYFWPYPFWFSFLLFCFIWYRIEEVKKRNCFYTILPSHMDWSYCASLFFFHFWVVQIASFYICIGLRDVCVFVWTYVIHVLTGLSTFENCVMWETKKVKNNTKQKTNKTKQKTSVLFCVCVRQIVYQF